MCSAAGVVEEGHTAKWAAESRCIEYSDVVDATSLDPFDKSGVDRLREIHFEYIYARSALARVARVGGCWPVCNAPQVLRSAQLHRRMRVRRCHGPSGRPHRPVRVLARRLMDLAAV